MENATTINRRELLVKTAALGGGMALSFVLPGVASGGFIEAEPWSKPLPAGTAFEFSPWIAVTRDNAIIVRTPSPESGNGVMTQIAMTIAEELHCDWRLVRTECFSPTRSVREKFAYPTSALTDSFAGRSTKPERMRLLLQLGASARERLKAAAAQTWNVPVAEIEAQNSLLMHKPTKRSLRFGEVAARAAAIQLNSEPALKPQSQWSFLGKTSVSKLNNPVIVDGSAIYGIDVRLPGMLYAALMQSPVHGGKLKRYDFEAIKNMPGVRGVAVVDPSEPRKTGLKLPLNNGENKPQSAIAVVADHYWQARKALEALPVEWDDGAGVQWKTTEQIYDRVRAKLQGAGDKVDRSEGDALKVLAGEKRIVDSTYLTPFSDQVVLEPLSGTARVTKDSVEVWNSAAISMQSYLTAAEEAGVPPENTVFHQTYVGGSFGRRLYGDDVRLVVAIAKKFPGKPVHVIWSREETTRQGRYRHLSGARLKAALDEKGLPKALSTHICRPGYGMAGMADVPYTHGTVIPDVRVESSDVPLHILWGAYRAPSYNSNVFFLESFIDECAAAAGIDPVEYRMRILEKWPDKGWIKCLQEVAARADWGKKLPRGQAQGVAISNWGNSGGKPHHGTTVATIAHVDVSREGALKVVQLDLAFDCGRVLNPDAVRAQMEGGTLFGLNMCLNEELNVQNGRIVEGNFDQYPMLRTADVPRTMNVHFGALSGHDRFSEVGEPPVGPVCAAVANAIYRATGHRIRTMPFRKHDLRWT